MNKQSLLEAGYREYPVSKWLGHEHADWFLQKRLDDEIGKKFYLNAYGYSFEDIPRLQGFKSIQWEVQFKIVGDEVVNISRSFRNETCTVEDVEVFFNRMFFTLDGAEYYELWGGVIMETLWIECEDGVERPFHAKHTDAWYELTDEESEAILEEGSEREYLELILREDGEPIPKNICICAAHAYDTCICGAWDGVYDKYFEA
jgi:hypothetical protein